MMKKTNKKSKKRFFKKLKIVIAALTLQSFYITIIYYRYDSNNDTNKNIGVLIHDRKDEWLVVNHKTSNNKNRKVVIVNKATTNTSTDHNTKRTTNDKKTSTILPPNNQSTDHQNPNLRSKSPSFLSSSVSIFGDEKAESNTTDTNVGLDNYQQHCGRSVVLIGIFCHLDDRNVRDSFRSLMKNPNNNNNKHGAVNACSLGSFLRSSKLSVTNSNNNRSKISDYCELIYVFVIGANNNTIPTVQTEIIDGNTRPIEMPIPDDLHSNLQDEYDHHQDDLLLLNIRQSNNSTGKTNTWFYYVSQILLKDQILYDQIDYIGKMDLGNSDTITKTTTTTATGASTSSSSFNLHQYFDFAHRNLPPSPYNQRLVAGSFIGYESLLQHWQRQMQGEVQEELLSTSTISRKHSPEQDHSSIHLYVHKEFYIFSKDFFKNKISIDQNVSEFVFRDVAHVSTLWKTNPYQRDDGRAGGGAGSPMESTNNATIVETLFDFSTLALQWPSSQNSYDPSPLHIVMISRQNKFWNTLSNDVDNKNTTAVATTVDKRILTQRQAPSSKNSRSFNLGDVGVPLSNLSFKIKRHSVVLMGVFCTIKDKGLRDVFRQIFSIHPNVCSLGSYQKWILSSQHHKDTNNTRPHHPNSEDYHSCEFVYAFVIGGNTSSAAPTQIVNRSHPILYPIEEAELAEGVVYREIHKKNRDDLVVLNIRENMNEGKSQTWLYFASMVMDMYGFGDYVGKMDTDTLLYLDQYFDFARQYLSPAPYNKRTLASHFADKAWWGRPHGFDKKERYFDMHYPGPTNRTSSIHVYAQGQLYMMSLDLAKGVAEVAQRPNDGKNPYEDHMEGIEDHDVSTMAFLACGHDSINLIVINDKKKFWKHPVKRKGRWGRLWNTEINRTRLLFNGTESIAPEDAISKSDFSFLGH